MPLWRQRPTLNQYCFERPSHVNVSYIAQTDIFHQLRIKVTLAYNLLEELEDHAIERRVFQTSLLALSQRRSNG